LPAKAGNPAITLLSGERRVTADPHQALDAPL